MKRGSLRCKIPDDIREVLSNDPFMRECIISNDCEGRIEWHHAFTYAGSRRNELWSILPLCTAHHAKEAAHQQAIRYELVKRILAFDMYADFKQKYPRSNLIV